MKTVHVAAGIIRKEGSDELLAVQRGYGDMQGLWEFPGGKLMRGETPEDAVRRELMEELQVKVTNLRDFYTVEYDYPDFHLSMECYYCSLADESDEPQKHDRQLDIRWIPRSSLATVEWMPADKGLIDALIELKEDRLEANGTANDAEATTTDEPATKPKRKAKRRSKKRPKPGLLDGIDTSDLSADERELVRRRAAIKKSMKGNKRANTKPELLVRQRLRAAGLTGYRLEWKVPGKPDIAFPGRKIAIFVNGCFWHRCPKCNPSQPK
ncbi:MAG: NUDIX domain-containing protein, partial [Collinsella sp.]|nr:NUDIX domain-containing protein [Collinsella sp.]